MSAALSSLRCPFDLLRLLLAAGSLLRPSNYPFDCSALGLLLSWLKVLFAKVLARFSGLSTYLARFIEARPCFETPFEVY